MLDYILYLVHPAWIELVGAIEDVKWLGSCWLFFWITIRSLIVLFVHSLYCSELFVAYSHSMQTKKINVHAIFWSFSPFITANSQVLGEPIFCACHFIVFWCSAIGYITICISLLLFQLVSQDRRGFISEWLAPIFVSALHYLRVY